MLSSTERSSSSILPEGSPGLFESCFRECATSTRRWQFGSRPENRSALTSSRHIHRFATVCSQMSPRRSPCLSAAAGRVPQMQSFAVLFMVQAEGASGTLRITHFRDPGKDTSSSLCTT